MGAQKRILVVYYSLTGQCQKVVDTVKEELEAAGHHVDLRRVTPVEDWKVPLNKGLFFWNWAKVWVGMNLTQPIKPMELKSEDYDYVILGFQTWNLAPSIPINSFLDSDMAEIFRGKKVIGLLTARGRWERSYRIAKDKIAARGGELVDGLVCQDVETEPANMITTVYYLFEGHEPPPGHWVSKFRPFGIGEEAVEVSRQYGKELALRFAEDRVSNLKGWRIVNAPLKLV